MATFYDANNIIELMSWADESLDGMARLQAQLPITSPELFQIIAKALEDKGSAPEDREKFLMALVATAIQKLSAV